MCMLTNTNGDYFCSVKIHDPVPDDDYLDILEDSDNYEILLCHNQKNGSEICEVLDKKYSPVQNSKEHTDLLSQPDTQNTFIDIQKKYMCGVCLFYMCPHQLNQTHRAASPLATTQVNDTSPG